MFANIDDYMKQRQWLLEQSESEHFSRDIILQKSEVSADRKLAQLRDEILTEDPSVITGGYYDKYEKLKKSKLYEALMLMPKPAVHHLHITAGAPVEYLIKLTYYDYVYYNDRIGLFKVSKKGIKEEGY